MDTIFGSLFSIVALQEQFLEKLQVLVDQWKTDKIFGSIFSEFVHIFHFIVLTKQKEGFQCYAEFAKLKSHNQEALSKMATEGSPYYEYVHMSKRRN